MHPALATLPKWAVPYVGQGKPGRGIIFNHPEHEYHGTKALVSKSALDDFAISPFHYYHALGAPLEDEDAKNLRFGQAYHVGVLQPDLFAQKTVVIPYFGPLQSPKNREARAEWLRYNLKGRVWLTEEERNTILAMRDVLRKSKLYRQILGHGFTPEVTALWTCPETGLRCKARADALVIEDGLGVDIKSALSAQPVMFKMSAAKHRYHVQDAFYTRAFDENDIELVNFVFMAQEKKPPYAYSSLQYNDTARARGEEIYMRDLRRLRRCIDLDYFPSYPEWIANGDGTETPVERVVPLDLPAHALKDWEVMA